MSRMTVVQMLPWLNSGGVERGTLEVARHLVANGHRSIVISAGGRMVEELVGDGSEHLAWDVGRKHLATLRWVPRLRRLLAELRPDILHLRSRLPAWVGYLAWRSMDRHARPRLVTTVHGPYTVNWYGAVMTRGERIIAVSEMIRDYVIENFPAADPARIRVIPRGVDPRAFPYGYRPDAEWLARWRSEHPGLEGKFVVTLPARLTRWKGQTHLIEVVAGLKQQGLPVHGLMVGGAQHRKDGFETELRAMVDARGLGEDVSLLGHRGDIREIMAVSDAVLSLSTEPEAFGRTTIEALAMGRPVAAYSHGGVREQLEAVFPAGAVGVGDTREMAARLAAWYRDPPAVEDANPFTLDRMLDATLEVYRELAASPR